VLCTYRLGYHETATGKLGPPVLCTYCLGYYGAAT